MRSFILLLVLAWLAACTGNSSPTPTASTTQAVANGSALDASGILGNWVNFHEQNEGDVQHWVSPETKLPRSMFRQTITFEPGGRAKVLCPSPEDAHKVFDGSWTLGPGGKLDIDVNCFGRPTPMHFVIVDATRQLLRLRVAK